MRIIENQTLDEERALYNLCDTEVVNCTFAGPADGESVLKETRDINVRDCTFSLRYPLWHAKNFTLDSSVLDGITRAPLWYCEGGLMRHCKIEGIKCLRESNDIKIENCAVESPEFGWKCAGVHMTGTSITSEYLFFESRDIEICCLNMHGKYSFQYIENMSIINSVLDTKDAFWHSKNVTVKNSVIRGEYLGWFSENLYLKDCRIIGTQPLCYCKGLVLENCTMEDADFAFEYSDVTADVVGNIISVKNPKSGIITADSVGEVIYGDAVTEVSGRVVIRGSAK